MARSNVSFSQFNPGSLQPAGQPSRMPYGVSSGDLSQSFITQTPMLGADGKTYVMQQIENPDGTRSQPTYITASPDGGTIKFSQAPNGQWTEGQWTPKTFGETVFGDKKLMAFLAIAGGGAALSAAYGTGGAGGAMLGSGTGATPGVVAGGTSGTAGLGGAGAAGSIGTAGSVGSTAGNVSADAISSAVGNPELGLIADPATYNAAVAAGIPPSMLQGGAGALTLAQIASGQTTGGLGQQALDFIKNNPNLLTGGIGALLGALGNKDDFTSTTTTTNTIDPAIAAYRDQVLGRLGTFGDPNNVPAPPSGATNTGPTSLQSSMMNFGGSSILNPNQQWPTSGTSMGMGGGGMSGGSNFGIGSNGAGDPSAGLGLGGDGLRLFAGGTQGFDMTGGQPAQSPTLYAGGTQGFYNGGQTGGPTLFRNAQGSPSMQAAQAYTGPMGYTAADNPLAHENNPYLTSLLDSARADMQKYYENQIAPKFASGSSFGSSGLGFAEVLARDDEAKRFADVATGLRFQDHSLRAQLQEALAGRTDAASQFGINTQRGIWNDTEAQRQFDNNMSRGLWQDQEGARTFDLTHARGLWGDQEQARQFNLGHERGLWQDQEAARIARMQAALSGLNAPGNTTQTTTQTAQGNPWLGAVGGWLAGSNLWKT